MAHTPVPVSDFPGLDLVSSPDASPCIDLSNVEFDQRGAVRSRSGMVQWALVSEAEVTSLHFDRTNSQVLVATDDDTYALDDTGSSLDSDAALIYDFVSFGDPTNSAVYCGGNTGGSGLLKWNGSAFSNVVAAAKDSRSIAVQPGDNRLVLGYVTSGGTTYPSRVWFSEAGDPETFGANDFIDLSPGDGGGITGLVSWGRFVFAFKSNRFFVFTGNSLDAVGEPVFNYIPVDSGVGPVVTEGNRQVAVGPEGVFFVGHDGVYLTTGGNPVCISEAINPVFREKSDTLHPFFGWSPTNGLTDGGTDHSKWRLNYHEHKLYLSYVTSGSAADPIMFVFDLEQGKWSFWEFPKPISAVMTVVPGFSVAPGLYFGYTQASGATETSIMRMDLAATDDNGTAIASHYQVGFSDLGQPGREKNIDSTRLWGTGTVAVSSARDFDSLSTATDVTLGTSPAIAAGLHNKSARGELISYQYASSSGGAWRLYRAAHMLAGARAAGQRTA